MTIYSLYSEKRVQRCGVITLSLGAASRGSEPTARFFPGGIGDGCGATTFLLSFVTDGTILPTPPSALQSTRSKKDKKLARKLRRPGGAYAHKSEQQNVLGKNVIRRNTAIRSALAYKRLIALSVPMDEHMK